MPEKVADDSVLVEKDKIIIEEMKKIVADISHDIEQYRFYLAGEKIYHYIWNTIADKILEENKSRLSSTDERDKQSAQLMLFRLLETSLIILHPFMPFVTEEIWQSLPERKTPLIIAPWPSY
jgi:valyl-tRNA synthetase